MKKLLLVLSSLLGLFLSPSLWAQATVYSFTGPVYSAFNNFTSPCAIRPCTNYPPGSRATGQFTTRAPLASNQLHVLVNSQVTSFSFTDGVNSYSSGNPNVRANQFTVSTDAGGNITLSGMDEIRITLWQTGSSPHAVGDRAAFFQIQPGFVDGLNNLGCAGLGTSLGGVPDSCTNATVDASSSGGINAVVPGTWSQTGTGQANYQGLWWASPAGSESGWGINFAHQGDTIFASWFTYDTTGKGLWLVMTAIKTGPGVYTGTLYTSKGPPFNAVPFNPAQVAATAVGAGTLTFSDVNDATFSYTVNGVAQVKNITREVFGTLPTCATATGSLTAATNYTDLWWASPAGSESGWGINLTQEGTTIFGTWFTYDLDGTPMWLVATAPQQMPGVFSGTLYRTTGPAFNAVPFNPMNVVVTAVGMVTFTFADGNNATFAYTVNGAAQVKAITREVFENPGTVCQ